MQLKKADNGFYLGQRFIPKKRFLPLENEGAIAQKSDKVFTMTVSSETPYFRPELDLEEVLLHNSDAVDLSRFQSGKSMVLFNHDPHNYLARISQSWLDNGYLYIEAHFKECPELEDVRAAILQCTSVGYNIDSATVNDDQFVVTKWTPLEASLVSIAADPTTGVMGVSGDGNNASNGYSEEETQEDERTRQFNIRHVAKKDGIPEWRVREAINSGESVKSFIDYAQSQREEPISHYAPPERLNERQRIGGNQMRLETLYPDNRGKGKADMGNWRNLELGLSQRDRANYSLGRLLAYQAGYDVPKPELELEASRALGEKMNKQARGAWIPLADLSWQRRDAALGTNFNGGGSLVETSLGEFVDLLRSRLVLGQMGITVLSGLSGNLDLPRMDQASTVQWISESELIPETDVSFDVVEYRPRTIASRTPITRRLLIQSAESLDVEMELRQDLVRSIAIELDRAAINGSGIGNEPLGLMNNSDVPEVSLSGSSVSWSDVVSMESEVALNNADINRLHYLMDPTTRGTLKTTSVDSGSGDFIFNNLEQVDPNRPGATGTLNGYLSFASTTVPQKALLFGNWADLVFAEFGVMDIASSSTGRMFPVGGTEVRAMLDVDIKPRRPYSFAKISDINP